MDSIPVTRASLLLRIRDRNDAEAWRQFVQLYAPVVYAFARRRQLQDADAADLTQDVLRGVSKAIGRLDYDSKRGSFRGWLFSVARNKLIDLRWRKTTQATGGASAQELLDQQPSREEEDVWDQEFRKQVFAVAAEQVRPEFEDKTWQAFWQTAVDSRKPDAVAQALGMSVGAVYIAKSRVQSRLKERVRELTDDV
jgi:RNA polymerase sigma-70 factor (ECF subfamily)